MGTTLPYDILRLAAVADVVALATEPAPVTLIPGFPRSKAEFLQRPLYIRLKLKNGFCRRQRHPQLKREHVV
jgi:hypothetical protein